MYPDGREKPSAVFLFRVVPQGFMHAAYAERRKALERPGPVLAPNPQIKLSRTPTPEGLQVKREPGSQDLPQIEQPPRTPTAEVLQVKSEPGSQDQESFVAPRDTTPEVGTRHLDSDHADMMQGNPHSSSTGGGRA